LARSAPLHLHEIPRIGRVCLRYGCQIRVRVEPGVILDDELVGVRCQDYRIEATWVVCSKAEVCSPICSAGELHPHRDGIAWIDDCSRILAEIPVPVALINQT